MSVTIGAPAHRNASVATSLFAQEASPGLCEDDELCKGAQVLVFLKENSSNENSSESADLDHQSDSQVDEFKPDATRMEAQHGSKHEDVDSGSDYDDRVTTVVIKPRSRKHIDDQSSHESSPSRERDSLSKRKRRGKLPDGAIKMLKVWIYDHSTHPYPSEGEKTQMMNVTGLSLIQLNNWFSNARRRLLRKDA